MCLLCKDFVSSLQDGKISNKLFCEGEKGRVLIYFDSLSSHWPVVSFAISGLSELYFR